MLRRTFLTAVLCCTSGLAHAAGIPARIVVVIDGDTVLARLRCSEPGRDSYDAVLSRACAERRPVKIRLAEIDAPEKDQPGGLESAQSLTAMVLKKRVSAQIEAVDKYGRLVAQLALDGLSINEEQLRRGMAWEYSSYHRNKAYAALEREARRTRRGLWASSEPLPPWEWRRLHDTKAPTANHAVQDSQTVCGSKRSCWQMQSCAEARFYLTHCGVAALDANGNGVPCENLCRPN